jgi:hypothetical protein
MSLFPCTGCQERQPGKYANVTLAWWPEGSQDRKAYRLKLCQTCYMSTLWPLHTSSWDGFSLNCPSCGVNTADNLLPTFMTAFLPGYGEVKLEMPMCPKDADELRNFARNAGELLPDRVGGQGPGPGPQQDKNPGPDWRSMGITPREAR